MNTQTEAKIHSIHRESKRTNFLEEYSQIALINPIIKEAIQSIQTAIKLKINVFLTGETGVGKSIIAKLATLMMDQKVPFVELNPSAIPQELFESELFGHCRGAFTGAIKNRQGAFQQANGGVLFMDEIADLSSLMQVKLLSAIEADSITPVGGNIPVNLDLSFVFASNKNIEGMNENEFRRDLFFRVSGLRVEIPPLRERRQDMEIIANHFLNLLNKKNEGQPPKHFCVDAIIFMANYNWPGNLREMRNKINSAFVRVGDNQIIDIDDLKIDICQSNDSSHHSLNKLAMMPLEEIDKNQVIFALRQAKWVQKDAAGYLDISPRVLNYKIKKFGITHPNWPKNSDKAMIESGQKKMISESRTVLIDVDVTRQAMKECNVNPKIGKFKKEVIAKQGANSEYRDKLIELLEKNDFNQAKTARELSVPYKQLRRVLEILEIDARLYKK